ncbi:DUF1232 domain-containing protein [Candidatus Fermentibacteria bacterium]|nr:DUF1232 domain-containing protein [Candidatus Fermentibacteria bacterium]
MEPKQRDYYQKLRRRIRMWFERKAERSPTWAEYILFAPDLFHLLCKLMTDDDVPAKDKAKVAVAIAYFISPFELVPEGVVGPIGYIDDIALAAYVLDGIINNAGADVLRRHWAGEDDVLEVVQLILRRATSILGRLWSKLVKVVDRIT